MGKPENTDFRERRRYESISDVKNRERGATAPPAVIHGRWTEPIIYDRRVGGYAAEGTPQNV